MGRREKKSTIRCKKLSNVNFSKNINNGILQKQCSIQPTIGLSLRLSKPFVVSRNEEEAVQYDFRPRRIFVNGLCLVCMDIRKPEVSCDSCRMVSYCSTKHAKENYIEHKSLCRGLTDLHEELLNICFYCICYIAATRRLDGLSCAQTLSADQYRVLRIKLIESLEVTVGRRLECWEREIVLYPRVCRICHNLCNECCPECGIEPLCSDKDHQREHAQWCLDFQIFRRILQLQREYGSAKPEVPNHLTEKPYELSHDLDVVIAYIFGGSKYYEEMDCHTYATLSHLSSIPLSTLYTLQHSALNDNEWRKMKSLTVHVIGAEFEFECANLRYWEKMFLHLLPALKDLNLLFIGPELNAPPVLFEALGNIQLCSRCRMKRRSINVTFHPGKLYHEISRGVGLSRPDMVCLFNPGLYRNTGFDERDTWPETIREFCKLAVPVVVTSYTEQEIPRDIDRIKSICEIDVILKPQRNAFASLKPDRNFVSDDEVPLIYKNYCVGVVKGKCTKSVR